LGVGVCVLGRIMKMVNGKEITSSTGKEGEVTELNEKGNTTPKRRTTFKGAPGGGGNGLRRVLS